MTEEPNYSFTSFFELEMGREKESFDPLSAVKIMQTFLEFRDGTKIEHDRKTMSIEVASMTREQVPVKFVIQDSPHSSRLSPPAIAVHIPWGCRNDDIARIAVLVKVLAELLTMTIFHYGIVLKNPIEKLLEVYTEHGKQAAQGIKYLLDKAGVMTAVLKPVGMLELSVRTENCLKKAEARIVADIVSHSEMDLLRIQSLGRKSLKELAEILSADNLSFGMGIDQSKYCDIISHALPRSVIHELISTHRNPDCPSERQLLLSLADVLSMTLPRRIFDAGSNLDESGFLESHPVFETTAPSDILAKTRTEILRILGK